MIEVPETISPLGLFPVVLGKDVGGFTDLSTKVDAHEAKISTNIDNIANLAHVGRTFTYSGKVAPTYDNTQHGNYNLVFRAFDATLTVPVPAPTGGVADGTILSVYNEDSDNAVRLVINTTEGGTASNIPAENFATFVYDLAKNKWQPLESGYIPAARINIANYIEQKLKADGKINTLADILADGFIKSVKVTGDQVSGMNAATWLHFAGATITEGKTGQAVITIPQSGSIDPAETVLRFQTIASRNQWSASNGSKYTKIVCVVDVDDNGFVAWYEWNGTVWSTYNAQGIIMSDSNGAIPKVIKTAIFGAGFSIQQAGDQEDAALITYAGDSGDGSITLKSKGESIPDINILNLKGIDITETPNQGGMGANEAQITAGLNIHMTAPDQQYGNALATELEVEAPLMVDDTPTGENTAKMYIKHNAFEPMRAPAYLAYVEESTDVVGKILQGKEQDAGAHHNGAIWTGNTIYPSGMFIEIDRNNKKWGIQEADELDPNITGGMDYLIAARIHMRGVAPSDGFVRLYLYNASIDPFEPSGYLSDKEGQPMAVERHYKTGEKLGVLDVMGIVNAKGLQEFTMHVVDNMSNDIIEITDRTEGASGILIQSITSGYKTSPAFLQFCADTNQNIRFSTHYLGEDRTSLGFITSKPDPVVSYAAGTHFISVDGWRLINPNGIKVGVIDGHVHIQDDGVHIADFNFGKIFSAEETRMLRGKQIDFTAMLTDQHDGYDVSLMKWEGKPDEYTEEIFTTRTNGAPTFQTDWVKADNLFITEDVTQGDHAVTKVFTVPVDTNNYALIIYPAQSQTPLSLKLKQFEVDVNPVVLGYNVVAPELLSEQHLVYDKEYKQLTQDTQGYASLRYTINNASGGNPMPVGELGVGLAPITIDYNVNVITGSSARGGEGALVFGEDGNAKIITTLRLWNEQISGTATTFWWSTVDIDGALTKLPDSEQAFTVPAGAKGAIFRMVYDHDFEKGAKIALRAKSDSIDGSFLQSVPGKPMLDTKITYIALKDADAGDDPFADIDLSQFDTIYYSGMIVTKDFANVSSITFNIDIPDSANMAVLGAIKELADLSVRPVAKLDWVYSNADKTLKVSFGETVLLGRVTLGIYL